MPSIENLDQFKNLINNLSDEVAWRAKNDEEIENVTPTSPEVLAMDERSNASTADDDEPTSEDAIYESGDDTLENIFDEDAESDEADSADLELDDLDLNLNDLDLDDPDLGFDLANLDSDNLPPDQDDSDNTDFDEALTDFAAEDIDLDPAEPVSSNTDIDEVDELNLDDIDNLDANITSDEQANLDDDADVSDAPEDPELNDDDDMPEEPPDEEESVLSTQSLLDDEKYDPSLLNNDEDSNLDADALEEPVDVIKENHFLGGLGDLGTLEPSNDDESNEVITEEPDFNLGDFAEVFAEKPIDYSALAEDDDDDDDGDVKYGDKSETEEDETDVSLDDLKYTKAQMEAMRSHLATMPRNLKIAIEEILVNEAVLPMQIKGLTTKLLKKASARSLAEEVRNITDVRIVVPRFYEKTTGAHFEERQRTFGYVFAKQVWPKLFNASVILIAFAATVLLLFNFLYRPIEAEIIYKRGFKEIDRLRYDESVEYFRQAFLGWKLGPINVKGWQKQAWFYRYAQAYGYQRQYILAEEKYQELIAYYPKSKKAYIAYGEFETSRKAYSLANDVYERYLNQIKKDDYDIMLAQADNYMGWAQEDEAYYERARVVYSTILENKGLTNDLQIRFLNYFIELDNEEQILSLMERGLPEKLNQVNAEIYANLSGWLLDHSYYEEVSNILKLAYQHDESSPAVHYQLARYYNLLGELSAERMALNKARTLLDGQAPFSKRQIEMFIDVLGRVGDLDQLEGHISQAEIAYKEAIKQYENALERRILSPLSYYGELYSDLGDLYYSSLGDFNSALINYDKALDNSYDSANMRYKRGYIFYNKDNYEQALTEFYTAYDEEKDNTNITYSLATTLAKKQSYALAEGFYAQLINSTETYRDDLMATNNLNRLETEILSADLMKSYNNLGLVYYNLSKGTAQHKFYYNKSLEALSNSAKAWGIYAQQEGTSQEEDLSYRNRSIIISDSILEQNLRYYDVLPLDPDS